MDSRTMECNSFVTFRLSLLFGTDLVVGSNIIVNRAAQALQLMMQEPDGPNKVKALITDLAVASGSVYFFATSSELYDAWVRDELDAFATDDDNNPYLPAIPYSKFLAGFKTLGPGVSILSFKFYYEGNAAPLNAQGVTLISLATSTFNVTYPREGNTPHPSHPQVMCTDTIYQPQALQQMALAPPVSVVQPYLTCHPTLTGAFVTAAGIAAANTSLVSSIFLAVTVFVAVQYLNLQKKEKRIVPPR